MKINAAVFSIAIACALASAQSVREFQGPDGLVRIGVIPAGNDSVSVANDFDSVLRGAGADSASISPEAGFADALLDIYFLEKSTGNELRFPAKYSQVRSYLRQHAAGFQAAPPGERMVAMVRDLSVSLCVRMKTPGTGEEK